MVKNKHWLQLASSKTIKSNLFFFVFNHGISEGADSQPRQWISTQSQKLTGFEKRTDQKKEEEEIGGQKKTLLSLSCHLGSD
jgi:hypothetical protein